MSCMRSILSSHWRRMCGSKVLGADRLEIELAISNWIGLNFVYLCRFTQCNQSSSVQNPHLHLHWWTCYHCHLEERWSCDNSQCYLPVVDPVEGTYQALLTIDPSVSQSDIFGSYNCTVENDRGKSSMKVVVTGES